mgnify:CR=1 FL=1|tara:strand:- start:309 stop:1550 length:1242 start_codon:yes stop_codon:yes gene_type:complete
MNLINKKLNLDKFLLIIFSFYPLAILIGNFSINLFILTTGSLFFYKLIKLKGALNIDKKNFFLLIFFFISLCINLIFSNNVNLSYQRVVKFIFVIFFILAFSFLIKNYFKNLENIFKIWSFIFLIVIIDLLIEFSFGKNLLGQNSIMPGRLASFTGEESVIGGFYLGFCLIFLSYIYKKNKNVKLNLLIAISLIIISFLIGERANFIKTFIAIIIYIFLVYRVSFKIKILSFISIIFLIYPTFLSLNNDYKHRYFNDIKLIIGENGLKNYLDNSTYGSHRNVAKEIFLDNLLFGAGIKNFRIESAKEKYDNLEHKYNYKRVSNHPHELYYEFLSETGIFGLICFLIFIITSIYISFKNYLRQKNIYQVSGLIFIFVSILPIIPSGAFLSTMVSSIFWINYAIMVGYNNLKNQI